MYFSFPEVFRIIPKSRCERRVGSCAAAAVTHDGFSEVYFHYTHLPSKEKLRITGIRAIFRKRGCLLACLPHPGEIFPALQRGRNPRKGRNHRRKTCAEKSLGKRSRKTCAKHIRQGTAAETKTKTGRQSGYSASRWGWAENVFAKQRRAFSPPCKLCPLWCRSGVCPLRPVRHGCGRPRHSFCSFWPRRGRR